MGLNELSTVLWREREALETLRFTLEVEDLLLACGRSRWIARATREVEAVLDQIRGVELARAIEAEEAARDLGIGEGASLLELAAAAPVPWNDLLRSHHVALTRLASQVDALAYSTQEALKPAVRSARDALMDIGAAMELQP